MDSSLNEAQDEGRGVNKRSKSEVNVCVPRGWGVTKLLPLRHHQRTKPSLTWAALFTPLATRNPARPHLVLYACQLTPKAPYIDFPYVELTESCESPL